MNASVPNYRPILQVETASKNHLPVSMTLGSNGETLVISRYGDSIWDFWPSIPQENLPPSQKRINWNIKMPDGKSLLDPKHANLLESAKDFLYSLFTEPIEGNKRPKMSTIINKSKDLKPLLRWMVENGLDQFVHLSSHTFAYVPYARISTKGGHVRPMTHYNRLLILEYLYQQADKLQDALNEPPWTGESANSLSGIDNRMQKRRPQTKVIPNQVVKTLVRHALDYVRNKGPLILNAQAAADLARANAIQRGVKSKTALNPVAAKAVKKHGFQTFYKLKKEVTRLRSACYIVVCFFSDIRDSEMLSLETGCIHRKTSRDGTCELSWLTGTIFKTKDTYGSKSWLVPTVVEEAIDVLEQLAKPYQARLLTEKKAVMQQLGKETLSIQQRTRLAKRLDTTSKQSKKLFLARFPRAGEISVVSGSHIRTGLKSFCRDLSILGENGEPWQLTAHQFRRTFAVFVAKSDLGDLNYLREHFGHWSMEMTLLYADGALDGEFDTDLFTEVLQTKGECQTEIIKRHILDEVPLANGSWLADFRSTVKTAKNKEELINELSESFTLTGTGHSWCVGSAHGHGCESLCVLEPDMCVDCSTGIISAEHLPVWKEIAKQQQEVLSQPDLGTPGKKRAKRILDKANEVLIRLNANPESAKEVK